MQKPNGPKIRPPKSSKSSEPVEEDIEIEIAEVLGLMKQSKSSKDQDNIKNSTLNLEAKDRNGISDDFKTWVTSLSALSRFSDDSNDFSIFPGSQLQSSRTRKWRVRVL